MAVHGCTFVLNMFDERVVGKAAVPGAATAEDAIRVQMPELIRWLNGFPGKVAADIIAEGQSESGCSGRTVTAT